MAKTDTLLPSPDIRDVWGYRFTWTPEHLTTAELLPLRSRYDTLADAALGRLSALRGKRDLYTTLAEEHAEGDPVLQELWEQTQTVPEWVDWEQIGRGQEVFYRYGGAMLTALAFHSLLGGMVHTYLVVGFLGRELADGSYRGRIGSSKF